MSERLSQQPPPQPGLRTVNARIATDLDQGSEPQCNIEQYWVLPEHQVRGNRCVGSGTIVYNTELTSEFPPTTQCGQCNTTFYDASAGIPPGGFVR